jgi:hypothetical protein
MVVNFRTHEISRGAHKLIRTPTLIKKIQKLSFHHIVIVTTLISNQRRNYLQKKKGNNLGPYCQRKCKTCILSFHVIHV